LAGWKRIGWNYTSESEGENIFWRVGFGRNSDFGSQSERWYALLYTLFSFGKLLQDLFLSIILSVSFIEKSNLFIIFYAPSWVGILC